MEDMDRSQLEVVTGRVPKILNTVGIHGNVSFIGSVMRRVWDTELGTTSMSSICARVAVLCQCHKRGGGGGERSSLYSLTNSKNKSCHLCLQDDEIVDVIIVGIIRKPCTKVIFFWQNRNSSCWIK